MINSHNFLPDLSVFFSEHSIKYFVDFLFFIQLDLLHKLNFLFDWEGTNYVRPAHKVDKDFVSFVLNFHLLLFIENKLRIIVVYLDFLAHWHQRLTDTFDWFHCLTKSYLLNYPYSNLDIGPNDKSDVEYFETRAFVILFLGLVNIIYVIFYLKLFLLFTNFSNYEFQPCRRIDLWNKF